LEKEKIDLLDTTFTIPIKIEHSDRERNLKIVVDYISATFNTNIIICEQDTDVAPELLKEYSIQYIKTSRDDGLIHRTRQLNIMAKMANTPFIVNYDADVLLLPNQIIESIKALKENKKVIVSPYGGPCYDVPTRFHSRILEEKSLEFIDIKHCGLMNPNSVGGAVFWNKDEFIDGGMENERFISWGYEDNERFSRYKKLGYNLVRIPGVLYHLNHHRTPNSNHQHKFYTNNQSLFNKIDRMSKQQLVDEINTWSWKK
jgi:predicted glycosyltransferase involved in capsule biosynthesis